MAAIHIRRFIAGICLVLAGILAVFAGTGVWVQRNFLNTDRFTSVATRIIEDPKVQAAIAEQVTDQIVGTNSKLEIAKPFIQPIVEQIVASQPFQKVFETSVREAHGVFVGPKAKQIILNISDVVDSVKSVLNEIAPNLAANIPTGEKVQVTILEQTRLDVIWDTVDIIRQIVTALVIAVLVLTLVGFVIAPYRWRSLSLFGATTAISGITLFVMLAIGRAVLSAQLPDTVVQAAVQHAWDIILRGLILITLVIACVGTLAFLIGRFVDRSGGFGTSWQYIRAAWSRVGRTAAAVGTQAAQATRAAMERTSGAAQASGAEGRTETIPLPMPGLPEAHAVTTDVASAESQRALRTGRGMWNGLRPVWRAVILVAVGVIALFQPGGLVNLIVAIIGIAFLWFAFLEGVTAWRAARANEPTSPVQQ
ncbi:MAG: hypothetical protein ACOYN3_03505 [Acidimicrobiia bacterium]